MSRQWALCCHCASSSSSFFFINKLPDPPSPSHFGQLPRFPSRWRGTCSVRCSSDSNPKPARGFGPSNDGDAKANKDGKRKQRNSSSQRSGTFSSSAPGLSFQTDGTSKNITLDVEFEERLQAVRRSALEQKKIEKEKEYGAIDYDPPLESERSTIGIGTKIGVGVALIAFGLVFALGDFIPSGSVSPTEKTILENNSISDEERATLQTKLEEYEATLRTSPNDPAALEAASVTLTELGQYSRAASYLEKLGKMKQNDPEVFRLLGEVNYQLEDYEGSAAAYRDSMKFSANIDLEVLRGLTNALLAAKKPDEAVRILLASRQHLITVNSNDDGTEPDRGSIGTKVSVDPVQVELLLGKAYSDWGHVSDAISVYDQLIARHPDDFRGYLAKGIILRENGNVGDAERMFIQARFFAPEKAKALVDRYSRL